jgi:hypothetical protein
VLTSAAIAVHCACMLHTCQTLARAVASLPSLQGLKRCHSGSEVEGDFQEPSLKRICGPRAMAPPPQLVLPSDCQAFMPDEPLLPAGGPAAVAAGYSVWRTGLTPRVSKQVLERLMKLHWSGCSVV